MRLVEERLTVPAETRAALQPVRQQLLQLAEVVPEETAWARPVERPRHLAVRQPLGPVPPGHGARSGHDGEHQVVGGVQGGGLRDQRAGRGLGALRIPGDRHVVEGAQRDRDRQTVQLAVHGQETLHGAGAQRLQLVHRSGVRGDQRGGQLLRAQTHPHLPEVGVADAPFPHPAALGDHRPQLLRRGMQVPLRVTLTAGRRAHLAAGLREIPEVVPAHVGHLPLRTPAVAHDLGDDHRGRRHQHDHAHDPHERMGVGGGEVEHHRRAHAERGQHLHEDALLLPARQLGRSFQLQLVRGHFGRQGTRWALDDDLAHRGINPPVWTIGCTPAPPW
ncbi:hypothetical protein STENM223S_01020 [Streptomyces tendae]